MNYANLIAYLAYLMISIILITLLPNQGFKRVIAYIRYRQRGMDRHIAWGITKMADISDRAVGVTCTAVIGVYAIYELMHMGAAQ